MSDRDDVSPQPSGAEAPQTATPPAPPYSPRPEWITFLEKGQDPDTEHR